MKNIFRVLSSYIKFIIVIFFRCFFVVFWIFPINKKKIFFSAFNGSGFNCNPYYIFQYLKEHSNNLKFVWLLNDKSLAYGEDVNIVKKNTFKYFFHLLTAGVIITNSGFSTYIPYRKKQLIIETWHGGGAYKHSGVDVSLELNFALRKTQLYVQKNINYVISSSKNFSECMKSGQFIEANQFLNIGMPRNDIFFNKILVEKANQKVRDFYNIQQDTKIILYAPTYRGAFELHSVKEKIDFELVKKSVEARFCKNSVIFFRDHYFLQNNKISTEFINVSDYSNMQELLCAADVFITDYSSCMWDFSLTYKPGFLFTPDIAQYENERGVYTPVSTWPFPYAKTTEALCTLIENYDEKSAKEKINQHFDLLQSFEDGHATEKVCNVIFDWINIEKV